MKAGKVKMVTISIQSAVLQLKISSEKMVKTQLRRWPIKWSKTIDLTWTLLINVNH